MAGGLWQGFRLSILLRSVDDSIAYIIVVVDSWNQKLEHDGWSAAGVLILTIFAFG